MNGTLLTVLGGVVVALITGVVTYAVARLNTRGAEKVATRTPYEKLADRVTRLEDLDQEKSDKLREQDEVIAIQRHNMDVLISDRDALVAHVQQWNTWVMEGAKPPPPPVPTHLRDLLNPADWDVAHITERTTTTTYVTPPPPRLPGPDDDTAGP